MSLSMVVLRTLPTACRGHVISLKITSAIRLNSCSITFLTTKSPAPVRHSGPDLNAVLIHYSSTSTMSVRYFSSYFYVIILWRIILNTLTVYVG